MTTDSAKKRYVVTVLVDFFKLLAGILSSTIVPRSLGPVDYGNFNFLMHVSGSIRGFLNIGTPGAFYTHSSRNIKSGGVFWVYYSWIVFQLIAVMLFILMAHIFKWSNLIFPGQKIVYIYVIAGLDWITFLGTSLIRFGDSKAETVFVQKVAFASYLTKAASLIGLHVTGLLSFNTLIAIHFFCALIICGFIIIFLIIPRRKKLIGASDRQAKRKAIKYFIAYCSPLIILEIFGLGHNFFNRWFLQSISGSVEQAYFSIANQWGLASILFCSSIMNVYWREISFSFGKNDIDRIGRIYDKSYSLVFFCPLFYVCS